jgi:Holliday junction resolvase RusA-like endonuclease
LNRTEFIIPFRPLSLQAADRPNFQEYKRYVGALAEMAWGQDPVHIGKVNVSIVFLCDARAPIDADNVIKPIQDALSNVVYDDDALVTDTDSHRRFLQETVDLTDCPPALIEMLVANEEAVYVRVRNARPLAEHL